METFYEAMFQEFANDDVTCIKINPTYNCKTHKDGAVFQVITLTIVAYNKYHQELDKRLFKFENNHFKVSPINNPQHLEIDQLEELFQSSLPHLLEFIAQNKYQNKFVKTLDKMQLLNSYLEQVKNPEN